MKLGNETLLLASRMSDKLIEWNVDKIMPYFRRIDFYTSITSGVKTTRLLDNVDNGCIKLRHVEINDDYMVRGAHLIDVSFSQLQKQLRRASAETLNSIKDVKIDRANVLYKGCSCQWVAHSHNDLEPSIRQTLIGNDKKGLLGSNSPVNRNMVLILSNISDIPQHTLGSMIFECKKLHIPIVPIQEVITKEKVMRISYRGVNK